MPSIRILLADDNPEVLDTLVDMLHPSFVVLGALPNGASLLEQAAVQNPDLIVLDISLGDMTGFEVAKRLRRSGCGAKIVFLTVHENIDFIQAAFDLGAGGYVFKSRIDPDLIEAIHKVWEGGQFSSAALPLPADR